MKCQRPSCEKQIFNDIYFRHEWGLVLCQDCFPWGKILNNDERVEEFVSLFEWWQVEYEWDEWHPSFVYYLELLEALIITATQLDMVERLERDIDEEDRSDNLKILLEEL